MPRKNEAFESVRNGDLAALRSLLAAEPALAEARDENGVSLLLTALYQRQQEALDALVAARSSFDLFEAAALGRTADVRALLDTDAAQVRATSADGFSALHLSAFFGRAETAAALIERGADVDACATNGSELKPINSAAAGGHRELVELLLDHGAEIEARQRGGFTALHSAAAGGNGELAALLVERGANVGARGDDGKTPADIASDRGHAALLDLLNPGNQEMPG